MILSTAETRKFYKTMLVMIPFSVILFIVALSLKMDNADEFSTTAQRNYFIENFPLTLEINNIEDLTQALNGSAFSEDIKNRNDWDELKKISNCFGELEKIFDKFKYFLEKYAVGKIFVAFKPSMNEERWDFVITFNVNPLSAFDVSDSRLNFSTDFDKKLGLEIKTIKGEVAIHFVRRRRLLCVSNSKESLKDFFEKISSAIHSQLPSPPKTERPSVNLILNRMLGKGLERVRSFSPNLTLWLNFEKLRQIIVYNPLSLDTIFSGYSSFLNIFKNSFRNYLIGRIDFLFGKELSLAGKFQYYSEENIEKKTLEMQERWFLNFIPLDTIGLCFKSVNFENLWKEIYSEVPDEEKKRVDEDIREFEKFLGKEKDFKKDFLLKIGSGFATFVLPNEKQKDCTFDLAFITQTNLDNIDAIIEKFLQTLQEEDPSRYLSENLPSFCINKMPYRGFNIISISMNEEEYEKFEPSFCKIGDAFVTATSPEGVKSIIDSYGSGYERQFAARECLAQFKSTNSFYFFDGIKLLNSLIKSIDFITELFLNSRYLKEVTQSVDYEFEKIFTPVAKDKMKEKYLAEFIKRGETPTEDLLEELVLIEISRKRTDLIERRLQMVRDSDKYKSEFLAEKILLQKRICGFIFFKEIFLKTNKKNDGIEFDCKIR